MSRRRWACGLAAPLLGAVLSAALCGQAAAAERKMALAEVGLDQGETHAACGRRGGKDAGACCALAVSAAASAAGK